MIGLYDLGLSEETIKSMIELNPNLVDITEKELDNKLKILKTVNCSDNQIRNIIGSNSLYLDRTNEDILNLINYLLDKGFRTLNILFDSNPYILNLDSFEIDNYINNRLERETLEDIIDDLDSNPYLFNEM